MFHMDLRLFRTVFRTSMLRTVCESNIGGGPLLKHLDFNFRLRAFQYNLETLQIVATLLAQWVVRFYWCLHRSLPWQIGMMGS